MEELELPVSEHDQPIDSCDSHSSDRIQPQMKRPTKFKLKRIQPQHEDKDKDKDEVIASVKQILHDNSETSLTQELYFTGFITILKSYEALISKYVGNCSGLCEKFSQIPDAKNAIEEFINEWVPDELVDFDSPTKRVLMMIVLSTIQQINENNTQDQLKQAHAKLVEQTERLAAAQEKILRMQQNSKDRDFNEMGSNDRYSVGF